MSSRRTNPSTMYFDIGYTVELLQPASVQSRSGLITVTLQIKFEILRASQIPKDHQVTKVHQSLGSNDTSKQCLTSLMNSLQHQINLASFPKVNRIRTILHFFRFLYPVQKSHTECSKRCACLSWGKGADRDASSPV